MSEPIEKILTKATVKKVSSMAAKGGSVVVSFEMPLIDEGGALLLATNKTCALLVDFTSDGIAKAEGQMELGFAGEDGEEGMD